MVKLNWGNGTGIGLQFNDDSEYYEILGYLSKDYPLVCIYTHDNELSGAWSGQGKLETKIDKGNLPNALKRSFIQSGDDRLSVTDYVRNLINNHSFKLFFDPTGNKYTYYRKPSSIEDVKKTVPEKNLNDFNRGYYL